MNYEKKVVDGTEYIVFKPADWGTLEGIAKKNEALVEGITKKIGTYSVDEIIELGITAKTATTAGTQAAGTGTMLVAGTSGTAGVAGFDPNILLSRVQEMISGVATMVDQRLSQTIGTFRLDMTKEKVQNLAVSRGFKIDDMFINVEQGKPVEEILKSAQEKQKVFLESLGVKLSPAEAGLPGAKRDINVLTKKLEQANKQRNVTEARKIRTQIELLKTKGNI